MKLTIATITLMFPVAVFAQNFPQMNQQKMQDMMQQMQKMQTCMQNVDQTALEALGQRAKQMEKEVKALCAAGNRSGAEDKAIAFGRQVANDPALQKMKQCGDQMKHMMPDLSKFSKQTESDSTRQHICDN